MSRENIAKKIRAKLNHLALHNSKRTINELRIIVALQRAIARIDQLPELSKHIVFKGGFVLLKTIETERFTRDLDVLARGLTKEEIPPLVKKALKIELNDGMWYGDPTVKTLTAQEPYGGWQFVVPFQIGAPPPANKGGDKKLSRVCIDFGIGDKIPQDLKPIIMPSISHEDKIEWVVYPLEYIFAEKLEVLFSKGESNSRAKDIYDLGLLFSRINDVQELRSAIKGTFSHRITAIPESFYEAAQTITLNGLKAAWPSVDILGDKPTFEQAWAVLLDCLKAIDQA